MNQYEITKLRNYEITKLRNYESPYASIYSMHVACALLTTSFGGGHNNADDDEELSARRFLEQGETWGDEDQEHGTSH